MKKMGVIQEWLGEMLLPLRTRRNDRESKYYSYSNARSVGILYNVADKDTHQRVAQYAQFLQDKHSQMRVTMLGYMEMPGLQQCLSSTVPSKYFTADDFSWSGKLLKGDAYDFAKQRFDILLDITTETLFPTAYVLRLSNASTKVGRCAQGDMPYFISIDTKNENTIAYLITQINVYLTKIKANEQR